MKISRLPIALSLLLSLAACDEFPASKDAQATSQRLATQGYELLAQQQPGAALAIFEQAVGGDGENIRALQGKGLALNQLGKHEAAEAAYGAALKIEPGAVSVNNNLAMSKILRGKYQEAIDLLKPLASTPSPNQTVIDNLALANCLLGKSDEAKTLYSKGLSKAEAAENLRFCKKFVELKRK